uniref:Sodium-coupled monocarboxylate transporter 1 n=1 Tax=Anopheles epiroticus TaxID=199890 RepID=A0A182PQR3_9DIPT
MFTKSSSRLAGGTIDVPQFGTIMASERTLKSNSGEEYSYYEAFHHVNSTIDSIGRSLQHFDWPDYVVFVWMLVVCIMIGILFGYRNHVKRKSQHQQDVNGTEAQDYLVGGRRMKIFPVAVSLVASWVSGVPMLGTATEIYVYGTQFCYIVFSMMVAGVLMNYLFLPVFHELQITSTYEGGLKAVVWTDVIQSGMMLLSLLAVLVKGTYDVGGPLEVIRRSIAGNRLEAPNFDPDPTLRHSFWIMLLGAPVWFLDGLACSQGMIQRFLALPTLKDARKALKGFVVGWMVLNLIFFSIGLLVYAAYHECDPLTTKLVKAKDQLLPLFVMETFAEYPGMAGVFVAGIFSAALSSLSTALNALSAVTLEDFCKPYSKKPLTEVQTRYIMRGSVLVYGALTVLLSMLVEHLGTIMQLAMTLSSASAAPLLGMFVMGILMPWVNGTGALYGGITGLLTMFYMCYNAQYSIATGSRSFGTKPVSVAECSYNFSYNNTADQVQPDSGFEEVEKSIYHISYMYFTLFGMSVTCLAGTVISMITKFCSDNQDQPVDPKLLAPCIRRKQTVAIVRNIDVHTGHSLRSALVPKRYQTDHVVLVLGVRYRADQGRSTITAARILTGLAASAQETLMKSEVSIDQMTAEHALTMALGALEHGRVAATLVLTPAGKQAPLVVEVGVLRRQARYPDDLRKVDMLVEEKDGDVVEQQLAVELRMRDGRYDGSVLRWIDLNHMLEIPFAETHAQLAGGAVLDAVRYRDDHLRVDQGATAQV